MTNDLGACFGRWAAGRTLMAVALVVAGITVAAETEAAPRTLSTLTNLSQLRLLDSASATTDYAIRIEGTVWWASPAEARMVLRDASAAEELEAEFQGQSLRPGTRVLVQGNGPVVRRGSAFRLGTRSVVVDNDGLHGMNERFGTVHLSAGKRPLRLDWFNGVEKFGLELEYEGPGLPRQRLPDAALFRREGGQGATGSNFVNGLDCRCYEGVWESLPDFGRLSPSKTGTVTGFDLGFRSRDEHVALQFTGYIDVARDGLYTFYLKSDDGSALYVGEPSVRVEVIGEGVPLPLPHRLTVGQMLREGEENQWAEVEGRVTLLRPRLPGMDLELSAGTGRLRVRVADSTGLGPGFGLDTRIRAVGFCESAFTSDGQRVPGVLLVPSGKELRVVEAPVVEGARGEGIRVLSRASEVHQLKREEAEQRYPVRIRGVVTSVLPEHQAFTLEDSTRGLYVEDWSTNRIGPPEIGEFLEVAGFTDPSLFAPIVHAQQVSSLGAGQLPEPIRPTWGQLMNGSLDAQYVEVQGIITSVQTNSVTLRTGGGTIRLELRVTGQQPEELFAYEDALVRIRGCLLAFWDYVTHQVKVGEARIYDADIMVDQPAPADLFSSPRKSATELLLFDPQASAFQRVRVNGQIVHVEDNEYFLMDGNSGLRFVLKQPVQVQAGERVEVVGFPELSGGASPVLREAVVRKLGPAPLPEPRALPSAELVRAEHDATRVRVEGVLVSLREAEGEQALELQNGVRSFVARLKAADGRRLGAMPVGCRLELTGVYCAQGGNRALGQGIASFELLLNSPGDLRVLARPPWWTLGRLVVIVGALLCVLAVSVLWITQLHRQVEERTAQLETQIQQRQQAEHRHAMEQERARVAQDLHDELGSGLTEISMLAARARSESAPLEKRTGYLQQAGDKARELVTALDEIVWAMNPKHDSVASLAGYFSQYAERFLGLANIACRSEVPGDQSDHEVKSRHRHQLFLAFQEGLTNVVRHSGATEVRLGFAAEQGELKISLSDNGRGLSADIPEERMDGIGNMRARLEKLGGRFHLASVPGLGTTLRFYAPLN